MRADRGHRSRRFPSSAITQAGFGDPLTPGGTIYDLCIYESTPALVAELRVDRAGDMTCSGGATDCWKVLGGDPPNGKGYKYKDTSFTAQGVSQILLKGGSGLASKILIKGKGGSLPLPIAADLTTTSAVTLQVHARGTAAPGCFGVTLSDIKKQESDAFKAK